jgi:hypothetical protein
MSNNIIFTDDKLRIQFTNQKSLFSGGSVSILYTDISSLSSIKNPSKNAFILMGVMFILFAFFLFSYGPNFASIFILGFGIITTILGLIMPSNYLGVETRGGSQYWVNVNGRNIFEIIDDIEKKRKEKL